MKHISLDNYNYIIKVNDDSVKFIQKHYESIDLIANSGVDFLSSNLNSLYDYIILKDNYYSLLPSFALLYQDNLRYITLTELKNKLRIKKIKRLL